ncbi:MAG: NAD(P)H-dependent glycerol-3-phosphate dehydrogenase [Pseudomonadota bacterium]
MSAESVAVIGAGSWGTALAIQYARAGSHVKLWGRDSAQLATMAKGRINERYLPEGPFPDRLQIASSLAEAVDGAVEILVSVPSHGLRETLGLVQQAITGNPGISWATKGLELATGKLPHEVVAEVLGDHYRCAVLSGPTFAKELARGLPTALTVASSDPAFAAQIAARVSDEHFRAYTSDDVVGVEVGGAIKNVMAIGAGLSDGLGFGSNTRVAFITRGLSEMTRFGLSRGAKAETFMGLAGMGDLVLTCTDDQSRNRRMGLALARGLSVKEAEVEIQQVVEGVLAARAVFESAQAIDLEMPITEQIYRIIYADVEPMEAVRALMQRAPGAEFVSN